MKGIGYIIDEEGSKIALVVDIKKHANAIKYFLKDLSIEQRKKEPKENFDKAVSRILKKKKKTSLKG